MMQAYTEEQRAELIQFNRAIIAQHEAYAVPETLWPNEVRLMVSSARIALAALTAKPVGYGIQRKDDATFGSWLKPKHLVKEDLIYRPAPLYTTPPVAAPAVPAGWKIVPVKPTAAMYDAGDQQLTTKQVWDSMLAAAPEVE